MDLQPDLFKAKKKPLAAERRNAHDIDLIAVGNGVPGDYSSWMATDPTILMSFWSTVSTTISFHSRSHRILHIYYSHLMYACFSQLSIDIPKSSIKRFVLGISHLLRWNSLLHSINFVVKHSNLLLYSLHRGKRALFHTILI